MKKELEGNLDGNVILICRCSHCEYYTPQVINYCTECLDNDCFLEHYGEYDNA